jgi:hypothetical protein
MLYALRKQGALVCCYVFIEGGRHKTVLMTFDEEILLWVCDKKFITYARHLPKIDASCR